eukprot:TRINITY_DN9408_c0_g1_i1.p1 TRINITY_DN9408_c0_g1~~TRINITY_DN9408_c0_g1_i1.p1  ORF type:complete len:872 (-),score=60.41 TRINITY_DN9408_c0_g1_i1:162-2777(-)
MMYSGSVVWCYQLALGLWMVVWLASGNVIGSRGSVTVSDPFQLSMALNSTQYPQYKYIVLANATGSTYVLNGTMTFLLSSQRVSITSPVGHSTIRCAHASQVLTFIVQSGCDFLFLENVIFAGCSSVQLLWPQGSEIANVLSVVLTSVRFVDVGGSGVYIGLTATERSSVLVLDRCRVADSTSTLFIAGSISISDCEWNNVDAASVTNNSSSLAVQINTALELNNTKFIGNSGGPYMGTIEIDIHYMQSQQDVSVKVANCTFNANVAQYHGTLTVSSTGSANQTVSVVVQDSTFLNNSATYGGGIKIFAPVSSPTFVTIKNCLFDSNNASYGGGVALLAVSSPIRAFIYSTTFTGNQASEGGALWINSTLPAQDGFNCTATLLEVIIADNVASMGVVQAYQFMVFMTDCMVTRNYGGRGALVYKNVEGTMSGCDVSLNTVSNASLNGAAVLLMCDVGQTGCAYMIFQSSINFNAGIANGLYVSGMNVHIQRSYIWGNALYGIMCNGNQLGFITIDASQSNSIYQNGAGLPSPKDTKCNYCMIVLAGDQGSACCNQPLGICGTCSNDGSTSCLATNCKIPYSNCSTTTTLSRPDSNALVTYSGANPTLVDTNNNDTDIASLLLYSIGETDGMYLLSEVAFLPSPVYATDSIDRSIVTFVGFLPNGAKISFQHSLFGSSQDVKYAQTSFTVGRSNLKVTVSIEGWPTNAPVIFDIRLKCAMPVNTFKTEARPSQSIIEDTTISQSNHPSTTPVLSLANVFESTTDSSSIATVVPVTSIKRHVCDTYTVCFLVQFPGIQGTSVLYDPDVGALVGESEQDHSDDDSQTLLVEILVPVLVGSALLCLCCVVLIAVVIAVVGRVSRRSVADLDTVNL